MNNHHTPISEIKPTQQRLSLIDTRAFHYHSFQLIISRVWIVWIVFPGQLDLEMKNHTASACLPAPGANVAYKLVCTIAFVFLSRHHGTCVSTIGPNLSAYIIVHCLQSLV